MFLFFGCMTGREEGEEVELKRLESFLQKTVLPLLNAEVKLFAKQTRSKLKEKVKSLEERVEQKSHKNTQLKDSLDIIVQEHGKVFQHKKNLSIEKVLLEQSLKTEKEKIQNGLSKIRKKEKEIDNLEEQVQNGLSKIEKKEKEVENLEEQVEQKSQTNTQLAVSLKFANSCLHKKNEEYKALVTKHREMNHNLLAKILAKSELLKKNENLHREVTEQNKKLNLAQNLSEKNLKETNKTIQDGISKIKKFEEQIANLEKLSLTKDALLAECRNKLEVAETKLDRVNERKNEAEESTLLGEGAFGKVYKQTMAVKKIEKPGDDSEKEVKTLMGMRTSSSTTAIIWRLMVKISDSALRWNLPGLELSLIWLTEKLRTQRQPFSKSQLFGQF